MPADVRRHVFATGPERPIAADHDFCSDFPLAPVGVGECHRGVVGVEVVQCSVGDLVVDLLAGRGPRVDQVLLHLGLPVDPDRAAGQVDEVDVVALVGPLQVDTAVPVALALQPLAQPATPEQVDRGLLEDAGADPGGDVLLRAGLQHDRLDAVRGEQVREEHSGGAGSDDRHLGAQVGSAMVHSSVRTLLVLRAASTGWNSQYRAADATWPPPGARRRASACSRLRLDTTKPSEATTSSWRRIGHCDRAGAETHLLDRCGVVVAQHLCQLAAQLSRLGDGVRRDPEQLGQHPRAARRRARGQAAPCRLRWRASAAANRRCSRSAPTRDRAAGRDRAPRGRLGRRGARWRGWRRTGHADTATQSRPARPAPARAARGPTGAAR